MRGRTIKLALILAGTFTVTIGALLLWVSLRPLPRDPMPNPNGYDGLVEAGKSLGDLTIDPSDPALSRSLVQTNAHALRLARRALAEQCLVPYWDGTNGNHVLELPALKRLAQLFIAEGAIAERDRRFADAAHSFVDTIRLGHEASRGGTVIDAMVGNSIELMGLARLQILTMRLDGPTCRESAAALEAMEARRESLDLILRHERTWQRRTAGLKWYVIRLVEFRQLKQMEVRFAVRHQSNEVIAQRALISLASRAYQLEHGSPPTNDAALVPDYLKALPVSPYAVTNR